MPSAIAAIQIIKKYSEANRLFRKQQHHNDWQDRAWNTKERFPMVLFLKGIHTPGLHGLADWADIRSKGFSPPGSVPFVLPSPSWGVYSSL